MHNAQEFSQAAGRRLADSEDSEQQIPPAAGRSTEAASTDRANASPSEASGSRRSYWDEEDELEDDLKRATQAYREHSRDSGRG